ncbi:helix-turn-helix domain-containing protein [Salmonella enterica]|nr:helix-turn-helix domain-containing protein [Salmonella enterica]ECU0035134.1 helix-turn-helix domain-containing protein [Salmonella enterica subsp. enterica serovar Eastbourne]EAR4614443.1 helix-turn-helix domain-containing protein [Salmonella enterica]EAR7815196.1 helix-turn-helix domain-containing protein [Salmonella enterica]EDH3397853.1 helix-turn-helix transcriptional regulator [Salmonella enterica]
MVSKLSVITLTPCNFLQAGLEGLLEDSSLPLRVLHVSCVDEAWAIMTSVGAAMILVARESDSPAGMARVRAQMRRLDWLMVSGGMPLVPCLLLGGDMSITVAGKTFWLTRKYVGLDLDILLGGILSAPEIYLDMSAWIPLSEQQKVILEGTLAGVDVAVLAEQMRVLPRTVFSHRNMLIKKLGLHNRLELMCLSPLDFAGMDDMQPVSVTH